MKVWEKISEFKDAKEWNKERIASECYMHRYCPVDIEEDNHFIGNKDFCNTHKCDMECLNDYLDMEVSA